jgi:hypothetical protein
MNCASRFWSPATSSPPSVVRSSRRSGTMQAACGPWASAMPCISSVAAISKFSGNGDRIHDRGDIGIADVAPVLAQMRGDPVGARGLGHFAARTGSGSAPPRAFLSVATWSMFTPSLSLSVMAVSNLVPGVPPGQSTAPACRRSLSIFLRNRAARRVSGRRG